MATYNMYPASYSCSCPSPNKIIDTLFYVLIFGLPYCLLSIIQKFIPNEQDIRIVKALKVYLLVYLLFFIYVLIFENEIEYYNLKNYALAITALISTYFYTYKWTFKRQKRQ